MFLLLAVLVLSLLLLGGALRRATRRYRYPPGPRGLPILGYLPWINAEKPYETLTALARKYGSVCGLRMGSVYAVVLSEPRTIRQVLAKDAFAGRAPLYLTHGIMQGYGLICAEGNRWKEQRKFVTGCLRDLGMVKFGPKRDKMEKRILHFANECISKLEERGTENCIDPLDTLHHCMGNLINDIVFGKTYSETDKTWKWLRDVQEEGVKHIGVAGPLNFLPFLRFLPRYGRTMQCLIDGKLKSHALYRTIAEKHRLAVEKTDSFLAAFEREIEKADEHGYFSEKQFYHLLADLFGAGTDTTLTTLRWFLLFMAAHPEEQKKIQAEMDRSLGENELTLQDRPVLPRVEAAIAEVQRLRSVTPLGIPHGTTEDTAIGDYFIPKGTMVIPLQWAVHTDPRYWQEPFEFKPDRFITEDGSLAKPEAFLPFQSGKRMCVGDELAKMMLFLFAGKIVRRFVLSFPPDTTVDLEGQCGITLVPKPHPLMFIPRITC